LYIVCMVTFAAFSRVCSVGGKMIWSHLNKEEDTAHEGAHKKKEDHNSPPYFLALSGWTVGDTNGWFVPWKRILSKKRARERERKIREREKDIVRKRKSISRRVNECGWDERERNKKKNWPKIYQKKCCMKM